MCGVKLVTAAGEVLSISASEHAELLPAVALGLGALGILVEVTLQCVPAFDLHAVEASEPLERVLDSSEERVELADHFEFYWFPYTERALTKTNTPVAAGAGRAPLSPARRWFDDTLMTNGVFRVTTALGRIVPATIPPLNRAAAVLSGGRSFSDAAASVFATRRTVRFAEMEYAIPAEAFAGAFAELRASFARTGDRVSFPVEVRFAAADELWMSTAHGRDTAHIAVHRVAGEDPTAYFREIEAILRAHDGRPHWGKLHERDAASLAGAYPRFADFTALRERLDPQSMFLNDHLGRVLGASH